MKLYLTQDVKKIGTKGQQVTVSEGFGRNYLLARGLASVQPVMVRRQKKRSTISQADRQRLRTIAAPLRIAAAANDNGTLYQAISKEIISSELRKQLHINLRPDDLSVPETVKTIGSFVCSVNEHGVVIATIPCEVIQSSS